MMKRCPKCGQTFADQNLNFCLNDGELLMFEQTSSRPFVDEPPPTKFAGDDSPPTLVMNSPRTTDPIGRVGSSPLVQWQGDQQVITPPGHHPVQYANAGYSTPNQVLAIVSLILGVGSLVSVCCSLGIVLNLGAIVTGVIALVLNKKDPQAYGGRGLAITGIVISGLLLLLYILFIIIYGLAAIGGALG